MKAERSMLREWRDALQAIRSNTLNARGIVVLLYLCNIYIFYYTKPSAPLPNSVFDLIARKRSSHLTVYCGALASEKVADVTATLVSTCVPPYADRLYERGMAMPSDDSFAASQAKYRSVLRIVRRAMHEYDQLGEVSKIKWVPPEPIIVEPKLPTRYCVHAIAYHEPCSKCERNSEDCKAYIVAAQQRLRDLLRIIGDKS